MADQLLVWLYGIPAAAITRHSGQLRLTYTSEALRKYELGTPVLSLSLSLRSERYTHLPVKAFIDGLLPEGPSRDMIAKELGIRSWDSYRLIEALGRDCAGAIVIQPDDEPPPPSPTIATAKHLTTQELGCLIANLRNAPLGAGGEVRISLAGIQEKLLLTRIAPDAWGQPVQGTPSTHILKPEIVQYPNTVENEAFCMRVAKSLGLDTASVETTTIGNRKLIIIERYDRLIHANGEVERLHQEDFCQATSTLPLNKYEQDGGPSLARIAGILEAFANVESKEEFLRAVTLNVILANGDAHAKNFSIIHERSGHIRLAPLYDLLTTINYYGSDDRLAMYIDSVRRLENVTMPRLLNEATSWGMSSLRASEIIRDIVERTPDAVQVARSMTKDIPEEIPEAALSQVKRLRAA